MSILAIVTGGTILTEFKSTGQGLQLGAIPDALASIFNEYNVTPNILYNILSEDITLKHLQSIKQYLNNCKQQYIIVLAGTDNMTLVSKYILITTTSHSKRIICLGSQRSPECPTYQGPRSVLTAIKLIKLINPGVYILNYVNDYEYELLSPTGAQKIDSYRKNVLSD